MGRIWRIFGVGFLWDVDGPHLVLGGHDMLRGVWMHIRQGRPCMTTEQARELMKPWKGRIGSPSCEDWFGKLRIAHRA